MTEKPKVSYTTDELLEIARRQKYILGLIPFALIAFYLSTAMSVEYIMIVAPFIQIYFIFKLAMALKSRAAWLYIFLMFIPLINLLALLHINGLATRSLQSNGVKVGARSADLKKLQDHT